MTEATLLTMIRMLLFLAVLAIIGRPFILYLRRRIDFFGKLDAIQELMFDAYFGGLIFYIIALLPFHLFSYYSITIVIAACVIFNLWYLVTKTKQSNIRLRLSTLRKEPLLEPLAVVAFFLISFSIQLSAISALTLGPIHDTSLHALFAELILENGQIPYTHMPYISAAIIFPQGSQVVFALASLIFQMPTPVSIFQATPLFSSLTVFAAYHFGKAIDGRRYAGFSFSFVFAFISMWPSYITWGGNTMIMAIPLFLMLASFLGQAVGPDHSRERTGYLFYCVAGLYSGFLAALHLSLFIVIAFSWLIMLVYRLVRRFQPKEDLKKTAVVFLLSVTLISPFIYRFALYHNLPGQNIGLPADTASPETARLPLLNERLTFQTVADFMLNILSQHNISPYMITRAILVVAFFFLSALIMFKAFIRRRLSKSEVVSSVLAIVSILLFLTDSFNLVPTTSLRGSFALYLSLMLLLGGISLSLWNRLIHYALNSKGIKAMLLVALVLGVVYVPFVYYRIVEDPGMLARQNAVDAVATEDDFALMMWIRDNLTKTDIILVSPFEPGLFIPALSQKIVIYPFSAYHLSASYANATLRISNGTLDSSVYHFLDEHNVSYVYLGTRFSRLAGPPASSNIDYGWNPWLFLANPNFELVKRIGHAYLFEYQPADSDIVLMDRFDYEGLDYGGWIPSLRGDGFGNVSLIPTNPVTGVPALALYADSKGEPYTTMIFREVFVPYSTDVLISLNLTIAAGYGEKDSLMLVVTNSERTCFLREYLVNGVNQFDLAEMWKNKYGNEMPKAFFIEILNCDVDSIETEVFLTSLCITIATANAVQSEYAGQMRLGS